MENVTARTDVHRLHGNAVGLVGVLFLTLTGSAPITAMLLNVPIVVGNGDGLGAPRPSASPPSSCWCFPSAMRRWPARSPPSAVSIPSSATAWAASLAWRMGFAAVVAYAVFEPSLRGGFAYFMPTSS